MSVQKCRRLFLVQLLLQPLDLRLKPLELADGLVADSALIAPTFYFFDVLNFSLKMKCWAAVPWNTTFRTTRSLSLTADCE